MNTEGLTATAEETIARLRTSLTALCTVESCTGGLIASTLTDVPGASAVFWGALITYDDSAKESVANVPRATLEGFGPVSPQTAAALAEGGLLEMKSALTPPTRSNLLSPSRFLAISITGIAGPAGGSPEKPVGLSYLVIACSDLPTRVTEFRADPSWRRDRIKAYFTQKALDFVLEYLKS